MIVCPHCGAAVDDRAPFCPLCFTSLAADGQHRRTRRSGQQPRENPPAPPAPPAWPAQNGYGQWYQQSAPQQPVQPQPVMRQPVQQPVMQPVQQQPAPGFERAWHARVDLSKAAEEEAPPRRRGGAPLPRWLITSTVTLLLLTLVLLASVMLIRADLKRSHDAKVAAYQSAVAKHPRPENYMPLIERYAQQYNLQPAYVCAIVLNESSFQERAVSRVGARGLMQIMEDTGSWIAQRLSVPGYTFDKLWDPETNIRFGCWYLNYLSKLFDGDPVLVTSAYHAGQGNVNIWLKNPDYSPDGVHIEIDHIPTSDTKSYVSGVMRDYAIYDALYDHAFNGGDSAIRHPDDVLSAACAGE